MVPNVYRTLTSPFFLTGLFLLLLNDLVLKAAYHNALTGKLSDFAGLFVFSLFFGAFFPRQVRTICIFTGLAFLFWKSEFSQGVLDAWNGLSIFRVGRTVDMTDAFALSVLPLAYLVSTHCEKRCPSTTFVKQAVSYAVIVLSVFAFTATSFEHDRNIALDRDYSVKGNKESVARQLRTIVKIKDLELHDHKEAMGKAGTANTLGVDEWLLTFRLDEPFCESTGLDVTLYVTEKNGLTNISLAGASFWCKEKPTEDTRKLVLAMIEKEIVENVGWMPIEKTPETK